MLEIQFFQLQQAYGSSAAAPVEVTVAELTELWVCSERNVKMILKKLESAGWIEWTPGRGRGHLSKLRFLQEGGGLLLELSKEHVQKGQMKEALELLEQYGQGTDAKARFMAWLSDYFGYTKETASDRPRTEILRFPVFRSVITLDPAKMFYAFEAHLVKQIFNTLVTFHQERRSIEPQLAHYWEYNEERLEWTFYLRRGIRFHHGAELTAHDAAFTFRRLMRVNDPLPHRWLFQEVADIAVPDDYVLRVRLLRPNHLFLRYLCFPATSILPAEWVQGNEALLDRQPIGTGPFQVKELTDNHYVLDTNLTYFEGRAHLDRVEIFVIPPEEFAQLQLPAWEQVICFHSGVSADAQSGRGPDWGEIHLINDGCTMMTFNGRKDGPQSDIRFRKALHHLMNRRGMIETLGENRRFPASGLQPHEYLAMEDHAYDPAAARKLLEEMGYAGEPFRIAVSWKHLNDALWVKEQCEAFGVQVEVTGYEIHEIVLDQNIDQADAVLHQFVNDEGEVSLLELFLRKDGFIRRHMNDDIGARMEKIAADLLASPSPDYRKHRFRELEALLNHEHVVLFLLFKELNTYYNPSVRGVSLNSLGWIDFKQIWLQNV
ncbi:ABC transporter substrate-binding protein [Paenibacillus cremeus]|nr:ABC transporter substrate-binding protein [Paenibacillus cremeus]